MSRVQNVKDGVASAEVRVCGSSLSADVPLGMLMSLFQMPGQAARTHVL